MGCTQSKGAKSPKALEGGTGGGAGLGEDINELRKEILSVIDKSGTFNEKYTWGEDGREVLRDLCGPSVMAYKAYMRGNGVPVVVRVHKVEAEGDTSMEDTIKAYKLYKKKLQHPNIVEFLEGFKEDYYGDGEIDRKSVG